MFFADTLKKVRKLLKMDDAFSILLDIDENKTSHSQSKQIFEEQFLDRMQRLPFKMRKFINILTYEYSLYRWNSNLNFRPSAYTDLEGLPVILIVVEKGIVGHNLFVLK